MIRILSIVAACAAFLIPSEVYATGIIASVARVRVQRVVVAPVVQRVVVQKVVAVQQVQQVVAVKQFAVAQIVQPVVAVQAVSYGYGVQQFVAPVQAYAAPVYGDSQALQIERERTKQEQLRTEAIRLQLTAPK